MTGVETGRLSARQAAPSLAFTDDNDARARREPSTIACRDLARRLFAGRVEHPERLHRQVLHRWMRGSLGGIG